MSKIRGLVLGWYNHQNAGDDRLATCITHWLHDHELVFMPHTTIPCRSLLDQFDYVLLGGGSIANNVGGVFRNMKSWIAPANIPVFCAGIGVSDFPQFEQELSSIKESGGHIWVRDEQSLINSRQPAGSVDVAPDLSWLYPLTLPHCTRQGTAINLRPGGGPRVLNLEHWEKPLNIVQDSWPWSLCFGKDDDNQLLGQLFENNTEKMFDPTGAARAKMVIAMRFHAVIFAIQTGTPFVAITHTKKLQYLLHDLGYSYAEVPYDQPERLQETIETVQKQMTSEELASTTRQVSESLWKYANNFKDKIENAVDNNAKRNSLAFRIRRRARQTFTRWS
ncbi:MAG: polysaccharide pyruvyl transferase family protein [Gimesia sp.]